MRKGDRVQAHHLLGTAAHDPCPGAPQLYVWSQQSLVTRDANVAHIDDPHSSVTWIDHHVHGSQVAMLQAGTSMERTHLISYFLDQHTEPLSSAQTRGLPQTPPTVLHDDPFPSHRQKGHGNGSAQPVGNVAPEEDLPTQVLVAAKGLDHQPRTTHDTVDVSQSTRTTQLTHPQPFVLLLHLCKPESGEGI